MPSLLLGGQYDEDDEDDDYDDITAVNLLLPPSNAYLNADYTQATPTSSDTPQATPTVEPTAVAFQESPAGVLPFVGSESTVNTLPANSDVSHDISGSPNLALGSALDSQYPGEHCKPTPDLCEESLASNVPEIHSAVRIQLMKSS